MSAIRIVIVDDIEETRENVKTILSFDNRICVVGEGANGEEAVELAKSIEPDIILMDINMPVMDGIRATEIISSQTPNVIVIIMSVQGEMEYLRKAMSAGARDYLSKPFSGEDIINTIIHLHENENKKRLASGEKPKEQNVSGKIIAVFSAKGGIGKSTIAVNLAAAIAREEKERVALVDLDLVFGVQGLLLNLQPRSTINDLIRELEHVETYNIHEYMTVHYSGTYLLSAPPKPEYAEYITPKHIQKILEILRKSFKYVVVDVPIGFSDNNLTVLDMADKILMISGIDLVSIKNTKTAFDVMNSLHYSKDKIQMVLNRVDTSNGITVSDIEKAMNMKLECQIGEDSNTFTTSINKGVPFVLKRTETKVAKTLHELALLVIDKKTEVVSEPTQKRRLIMGLSF